MLWAGVFSLLCSAVACSGPLAGSIGTSLDGYLFCFWNVENLFDDHDDGRTQSGDREFDSWFAHDPSALKLKLSHLAEALLHMNGGQLPY